jgi:hypothetical protein
MPSTFRIGDNLSPQPKEHVIIEIWESNIVPVVIGSKVQEIRKLFTKLYKMFCHQFEGFKLIEKDKRFELY